MKGAPGRRAYYALWRDAEGRHQRRLGPAWVKDSGRRTPRGAIVWRSADGARPTEEYLTPKDAEKELATIVAAAPRTQTQERPASAMTLREACDAWLTRAERDEVKRSTRGEYGYCADRICRDLGPGTRVALLSQRRVETWLDDLEAERRVSAKSAEKLRKEGITVIERTDGTFVRRTPASLRNRQKYRVNLHGIFEVARHRGAVEQNPVALVRRPGRRKTARRRLKTSEFLRADEVLHLFEHTRPNQASDATLYLVLALTGLRLGECLELRWPAIDRARASISVESYWVRGAEDTPKSHVARRVPMAPEVAEALEAHATVLPPRREDDLVFRGVRGGHVDANRLRQRFYAALDAAALRRIRLHDLRHTFGTVCAGANIPLTTIQEWMGHSDLQTTMLYLDFYPKLSDAEKISTAFRQH